MSSITWQEFSYCRSSGAHGRPPSVGPGSPSQWLSPILPKVLGPKENRPQLSDADTRSRRGGLVVRRGMWQGMRAADASMNGHSRDARQPVHGAAEDRRRTGGLERLARGRLMNTPCLNVSRLTPRSSALTRSSAGVGTPSKRRSGCLPLAARRTTCSAITLVLSARTFTRTWRTPIASSATNGPNRTSRVRRTSEGALGASSGRAKDPRARSHGGASPRLVTWP